MTTPHDFDHYAFLKQTPKTPGVYRMYSASDVLLYIGKAKNLHARLKSYFTQAQDNKTLSLVSQIKRIDITLTSTEVEALILEHNLIKTYRPRYNILLKDDKSYPFIYISTQHEYPRMEIYRGAKPKQGQIFGPYPNGYAAKKSLLLLQKLFRIRSCTDPFFSHRTRPCLQYQIKRCTGPCVDYIDPDSYRQDVEGAIAFLQGDSEAVVSSLVSKMDLASHGLHYEEAALYRDQIQILQKISQQQYVSRGTSFADVFALSSSSNLIMITQLFIRMGQVLSHVDHVFKKELWKSDEEMLSEFLAQYYLVNEHPDAPHNIILSLVLPDKQVLAEALSDHYHKKIVILDRVNKDKAQWVSLAKHNADAALARYISGKTNMSERLSALSQRLNIFPLQRMECFDISHTQGDETVASAVVFDEEGPRIKDYRRYNIADITPGDDYAAIAQALMRHYKKRQMHEEIMPDLIIIDGGVGQLSAATAVMEELQLLDITLIGVSKGPARKPGEEQIWLDPQHSVKWPSDDPGLHLIQHIRDEAHRFAIIGHRARRGKKLTHSTLEDIPGIGIKRRQALLKYFGGLQGLKEATIDAISQVPGISHVLATSIYYYFHKSESRS